MCLAIPAHILEIIQDTKECQSLEQSKVNRAKVMIMGYESIVDIHLLDAPNTGDYVLVLDGCAIKKIDEEYYNHLTKVYKQVMEEEV
ncbi:MAG: hydrogenase assembly chaperone hypC/hupF [Herbinix sp.]|jgi:hydrogenase assembly chaperone HypC/HupF|nr:hydrogenase assembly chaperone hypC/hupF [Herbinix sp.]